MTSIPELRASESQASETAGAGPQAVRGFDFDLGALGAGPASERIARRDPIPRPLRVIAGWSWRMLLIFAALVVAGRLVRQVWEIVLPLVLGLFLAAVLEPVAAALRRRGVPALLAAVLVFLSAMAVIVSVLTWIVTTVSGEFADLSGQLREARVELERWAQGPPLRLSDTQLARVTDQIEQAVQGVSGDGALADAAGTARSVVTVLSGVVLALFVLFFLLKDGETIGAWVLDRTPIRFRDDVAVRTG